MACRECPDCGEEHTSAVCPYYREDYDDYYDGMYHDDYDDGDGDE